jgi:hypothetical protein
MIMKSPETYSRTFEKAFKTGPSQLACLLVAAFCFSFLFAV